MSLDIDVQRKNASMALNQSQRSELGQYLTPRDTANFMASMFSSFKDPIRLLEAGAGIGSLITAFIDRHKSETELPLFIKTFEIDPTLVKYLEENLSQYRKEYLALNNNLETEIVPKDFILESPLWVGTFTHAILNPPYKKINSDSKHRRALRELGMEHVNLYSAFVALALYYLENKGELVAIIPRSFCNGLYYKPFRNYLYRNAAIKRIHLYDSRTQAFKDDEILQENIIIYLVKGEKQTDVTISTSIDQTLKNYTENVFPFSQIVHRDDQEKFIHIPRICEGITMQSSKGLNFTLDDLGVQVSTGPVVDFRFREYITQSPESGTVPLLYSTHMNGVGIDWPITGKKPNAIHYNKQTEKIFVPNGYYTIVKRFSSKEEKRRIVARVIDPNKLPFEFIGLENHLNYYHTSKHGVDAKLAYGLAAYLNSTIVEDYFRSFNGHTQVNATDLRRLKYPSKEALFELGEWAQKQIKFDANIIDAKLKEYL